MKRYRFKLEFIHTEDTFPELDALTTKVTNLHTSVKELPETPTPGSTWFGRANSWNPGAPVKVLFSDATNVLYEDASGLRTLRKTRYFVGVYAPEMSK